MSYVKGPRHMTRENILQLVKKLWGLFPKGPAEVDKIFVLFALPFGLILVLLTPPFQPMDERPHMLRAYQLSLAQIVPERREDPARLGGQLPQSLWVSAKAYERMYYNTKEKCNREEFRRLYRLPLETGNTAFLEFDNTALYSPVLYLPHLPGIILGRLFNLSPLKIMYLGRFTGLLGYIALMVVALRLAPFGRWLFFLLGLMPVSLFVGSAINADPVTLGIAFIFTAFCLKLAYEEGPLPKPQFYVLLGLGACLALCKGAYVPLLLLFLLIPRTRFNDRRRWLLAAGIFFGACLAVFALWAIVTLGLHTRPRPGVDAAGQIRFILGHPFEYLKIVMFTLHKRQLHLLFTMVGGLGHLDAVIPNLHFISYLCVLLFAALVDAREDLVLDGRKRLLLAAAFVLNSAFLITVVYVNSIPVGDPEIYDLSGRYWIACAPLLLLLLNNRNYLPRNPDWHRWFFISYTLVSLISTSLTIYGRYYVPS